MKAVRWQKEVGIPTRWSRPPMAELTEIMKNLEEPKVFIRPEDDGDAIIIKFPRRSHDELMTRLGHSLPAAFEEILWRAANKGENTRWSEFEKIGRESYRAAWLMLFERKYKNRRDPAIEDWLKEFKGDLEAAGRLSPRRGRKGSPSAKLSWFEKQFDEIFSKCVVIHRAAENAQHLNKPSEIKKAIWDSAWKTIQTVPNYGAIMSGDAFDEIVGGKCRAQLHDPTSWNPRQLTIALLKIQTGDQYQTLEKQSARIRPARRK